MTETRAIGLSEVAPLASAMALLALAGSAVAPGAALAQEPSPRPLPSVDGILVDRDGKDGIAGRLPYPPEAQKGPAAPVGRSVKVDGWLKRDNDASYMPIEGGRPKGRPEGPRRLHRLEVPAAPPGDAPRDPGR